MKLFEKKQFREIGDNIRKSFSKIRSEMDNHLDSINENTNEIQSNYEYLCQVDIKIDKLSERIDELQYVLNKIMGSKTKNGAETDDKYEISSKLSLHEQEAFLMFYTLSEGESLTLAELARKTGITLKIAENYINSLLKKGIPLKKVVVGSKVGYFLENDFKNYQTKHNVVSIHEKLAKYVDF